MNERLKELAVQAGFQYNRYEGYGWAGASLPKFADLIVQECIDIIDPKTGTKWIKDQTQEEFWKNQSVHLIKHKFGIDEKPVCQHDWYSARNPVVLNGSVCVICGAIDPREPEELKNESIHLDESI